MLVSRSEIYTPNPNMQLEPFQKRGIMGGQEFGNVKSIYSIIKSGVKNVLAVSPGGSGKCLGIDTPILMYDGRIKMVQDVKIGDKLMGVDGTPRNVLSTCIGSEELYRVSPNKGDSFVCNKSHILSFKMSKTDREHNCKINGVYYETEEVVNLNIIDYINQSEGAKELLKCWRTGVKFMHNIDVNLKIDPYFLGLWLGDGNSKGLSVTSGDIEIKEYLFKFADKNKMKIRVEDNSENSKIYHLIFEENVNGRKQKNPYHHLFIEYNLINNKHIPFDYKTSPRKDRLALLAGLMDSDGSMSSNCFDITLKQKHLIEDIAFIARSLGFAAFYKECKKTCTNNGVTGTYYRLSISGNTEYIPTKILRKKASKRISQKNVLYDGIRSIESIGIGDYYGFEIDGDRLFMLGDFTVTHNTVIMAKVAYDFISISEKDVAIFVHRKELLNHSRIELDEWYGIYSQAIDASTKTINSNCRVYVCMVETFDRRSIEAFLKYFDNVGLYMIDECHLNHFTKVFKRFPNAIRIGFTATPISGNKLEPLNLYYDDIVVIATINELIELNKRKPSRGIVTCQWHDFTIDIGVDYKNLKKNSRGEFDEKLMGEEFSKKKQIQNAIAAYEKHCLGQKCIIFNANIEHSLKMHNEMTYSGFNSRHIDSDTKSKFSSPQHREFIFGNGTTKKGWLEENDNGILNNVGIATIGTDVKSIQSVFVNKTTSSFTLFWQMAFRGNRAYVNPKTNLPKEFFTLVDTGNNMLSVGGGQGHGVYYDEANFNWEERFRYPQRKKDKAGISPIKSCPECGAINSATSRVCQGKVRSLLDIGTVDEFQDCGYLFPSNSEKEGEDEVYREMICVSSLINLNVNVKETIELLRINGKQDGAAVYNVISQVCNSYKKNLKSEHVFLIKEQFDLIYKTASNKVSEIFKINGTRKWINLKKTVKEECVTCLRKIGFIINLGEIEGDDDGVSILDD